MTAYETGRTVYRTVGIRPDELEEIRKLAERHLKICEGFFAEARSRDDVDTAAHAARSALSVALNCAVDLAQEVRRETALTWLERLSTLYADTVPAPEYLSKALKWATGSISRIFPASESKPDQGAGEGP